MKTITDHIRDHLWFTATNKLPDLAELCQTEWNSEFEQLMRNRLIMGAFRYGLLRYKQAGSYDMVRYLHIKLREYEETGNAELLPDIANMALLEFTAPSHANFHWKALDDQEVHCPRIEPKIEKAYTT